MYSGTVAILCIHTYIDIMGLLRRDNFLKVKNLSSSTPIFGSSEQKQREQQQQKRYPQNFSSNGELRGNRDCLEV